MYDEHSMVVELFFGYHSCDRCIGYVQKKRVKKGQDHVAHTCHRPFEPPLRVVIVDTVDED